MEAAHGGLSEGAAKECGMYTAEEKQGDNGEEQEWRFQSGRLWCVVQMGFGAVEKMATFLKLQCKNQRNYCLELGWFRGRCSGGLLSDTEPKPRSREACNSPEKRHLLKQRHFSAMHWTNQWIKAWQSIARCEAKKWMVLLKHLAMKWEVTEGPVTCGGIQEEILRLSRWWHILKIL